MIRNRPTHFFHSVPFAIIAVCALLCIFNAYITGISEGRDAKINYGAFNDITAMAIAISEERYGFHEGYVGRPEVIEALGKILTPDGLMGASDKYAQLASDRNAIEAALQAASSLDPATFTPFKAVSDPFVVMFGEDTGLVLFYRVAFKLFGYHADSMYRAYFLLLTASALLFLIQARNNLIFAGALLAVLYGFQTLFYLDSFTTIGAPTVYSNRLFGTLGIIATLHILLFLYMQNRYDKISSLLVLLLQFTLLLFVITVRSSAMWQWISIFAWLIIPVAAATIFRNRKEPIMRRLRLFAHARWPALALLAMLCVVKNVQSHAHREAHDDIYFTDCTTINHFRWHSAYLALDMHPDWPNVAPAETRGEFYGDAAAWNAARTYWERKHPGERYSCKLFRAFPPMGGHDAIIRKLYGKFAEKHRRFMAELYFIYKPRAIFNNLKTSLNMLPAWWVQWVKYGAAAMGAIGFALALSQHKAFKSFATATAALALLLLASNMPAMFAYPSYMAETLMILLACMAFFSMAATGTLGALLGTAARKAVFKADARLPVEGV